MRRNALTIAMISIFFLLFDGVLAQEDETVDKQRGMFIFPSSLIQIEEEALSGTVPEAIVFPKGFERIEDRAFEGTLQLTDVFIPDTTEYIADSAFTTTLNLTIHGVDNSYAEDWATEHEIPFEVDDIWSVIVPNGSIYNFAPMPNSRHIATIVLIILFGLFRLSNYETRSKRPQDRPELNPIEYRFP